MLKNENNIITDNAEINLIKNFLNKQYSKFTEISEKNYFHEIVQICRLIKSKYEIIYYDQKISSILTNKNNSINNSIKINNKNSSFEEEIFEGQI